MFYPAVLKSSCIETIEFVFDTITLFSNKRKHRFLCIEKYYNGCFFYFDFIHRISAATATCFRDKVSSCRSYLRDYIGAYNLIFGGKCIAFLRSRDKNENTTNGALTPQSLDQEWMTTIQTLVNEGNKLKIYQRNESRRADITSEVTDIPSTPRVLIHTDIPSTPRGLTTPGFIFTDLEITRASVKSTQTTANISTDTNSTSRFIFNSKDRELFQTSTVQVSVQDQSTGDSADSGDTPTRVDGSIDNGASRDRSSGGKMITAQHPTLVSIITVSVVLVWYLEAFFHLV